MNIAIIGSGAAGLYLSILAKKNNPSYFITVFEKEEKLAKKLYATGNGHCNLLNKKLLPNKYNNPEFIKPFLKSFPYQALKDELSSLGVALLENEEYVYPLSNHAGTFVSYLLSLAKSLGIIFRNSSKVLDYRKKDNGYEVNGEYFDKVVIAVGGKSSPNLGTDGNFFDVLKRHGYSIIGPRPGLAPLKVKEKVSSLQGIRHHALVRAFNDKKLIFSEEGEVLFKKEGLSGIVAFNAESALYRNETIKNPKITLDLFPELSFFALCDLLNKAKENNPKDYLSSLIIEPISKYVLCLTNSSEIDSIATNLKHLSFNVASFYPFEDSQVTIGGVSLNEITPFLESKKEKGIYFAGEVLDIDGSCGGYNLSWALICAEVIAKHL